MKRLARQMKLKLGIGVQSSALPPEIQQKASELLGEQIYEYWRKTNEFGEDKQQEDRHEYENN